MPGAVIFSISEVKNTADFIQILYQNQEFIQKTQLKITNYQSSGEEKVTKILKQLGFEIYKLR